MDRTVFFRHTVEQTINSWADVLTPDEGTDIGGDKIYVFHDGIEDSIVKELLKAGIQENEIVIERHLSYARQFMPFAIS